MEKHLQVEAMYVHLDGMHRVAFGLHKTRHVDWTIFTIPTSF
jgi:hypothetical protein